MRCPIHGDLKYLYVACESNGSCDYVFYCPKCGVKLYGSEWEKINKIIDENKILEDNIVIGLPLLLTDKDIIPFNEDYKLLTYSDTLKILAIRLEMSNTFYVLKLVPKKSKTTI